MAVKVNVDEGYEIASVTADGNYKNLKKPDETGVEGVYRLTKVTGPVTVTITTKAASGATTPEEPASPSYTPVETGNDRVKGFYNDSAALKLELAGRHNSGAMSADGGSLEIVQYNPANGFSYAVSGLKGKLIAVDMADLSGETVKELTGTEYDIKSMVNVEGFTYGDMTSVAISPDGSKLAVAIQAADYKANGIVALFTCNADGTLTLLGTTATGVQPDMVTFADNSTILTADEGEPRLGTGGEDPKGSVTIVHIGDNNALTSDTVTFDFFDAKRDELIAAGVLIQKNTQPSTDFEPEYIAVSGGKAYVALQEANAIAVLDIAAKTFNAVYPLGFQNYGESEVDLENEGTFALKNYQDVYGIKMPDGISVTTIGGETYLLTANEGDSRADWAGMDDFEVKNDKNAPSPSGKVTLGTKVTWFNAAKWDGLDADKDYVFGSRSMSMYKVTGEGLELVFDSGSDFEEITGKELAAYFNCSNDSNKMDDRSGKKGPEPENVTTGKVDSKTYAFAALERIGGVMVYDITDPTDVKFINYVNSREFDAAIQGDVSPEGLCFIPATSGKPAMLLAACEVSGTLAAYTLIPVQSETPEGGNPGGSAPEGGSSGSDSSGSVTDKPSTTIPKQDEAAISFQDVPKNAYYSDAVAWATKNQITAGTTATEFSPNAPCTRAQIVTFLWRAAGSPEAKNTKGFADVSADSYYAKAVAWAVENGITVGTGDGEFSPNATCNRAQAVVLLFRAMGKLTDGSAKFSDVPTGSYYEDAVNWAVDKQITAGTSATEFSPSASCTRAQIVTFLYRTYQEK